MPKKRNSIPFAKPRGPVHPSLDARSVESLQKAESPTSVNERLQQLRIEQRGPASPQAHLLLPQQTTHPSIQQILQIPNVTPPRPRPGLRVVGGRRLPPGPKAPQSWLTQRSQEKQQSPREDEKMSSSGFGLPGFDLPAPGSLVDTLLKELARDWDFYLEYEQFNLPSLPIRYKELLIHYIVQYDSSALDRRSLTVLFQNEAEIEGGTGADGIRRLDLSGALCCSLSLKDLKSFFQGHKTNGYLPSKQEDSQGNTLEDTSSRSFKSPTSTAIPDSWDTDASTALPQHSLHLPKFHTVTHLSLSVSKSASGTEAREMSSLWPTFMNQLLPHLQRLTHLSLAKWPTPSVSPNSLTAYVASPTGSIPYGGRHYYSDLDRDYDEAVSILRRLSKGTPCLQWLDLTGCWPWVEILSYDNIDWVDTWGEVVEVKIGQGWIPDSVTARLAGDQTRREGEGNAAAAASSTAANARSTDELEWQKKQVIAYAIERNVRIRIAEAARQATAAAAAAASEGEEPSPPAQEEESERGDVTPVGTQRRRHLFDFDNWGHSPGLASYPISTSAAAVNNGRVKRVRTKRITFSTDVTSEELASLTARR